MAEDRRKDEVFTDNLEIPYCKICKDCEYREHNQVKGCLCEPYKKLFCEVYQEKPLDIIYNRKGCEYYKKEKAEK